MVTVSPWNILGITCAFQESFSLWRWCFVGKLVTYYSCCAKSQRSIHLEPRRHCAGARYFRSTTTVKYRSNLINVFVHAQWKFRLFDGFSYLMSLISPELVPRNSVSDPYRSTTEKVKGQLIRILQTIYICVDQNINVNILVTKLDYR